jgi:intron-binding protein aquarius
VADVAVVAKCHLSTLYRHETGKLFAQLVDLLQFYEGFEINDQLTDHEVVESHYSRLQSFQLLAFKKIDKVCAYIILNESYLPLISCLSVRSDYNNFIFLLWL